MNRLSGVFSVVRVVSEDPESEASGSPDARGTSPIRLVLENLEGVNPRDGRARATWCEARQAVREEPARTRAPSPRKGAMEAARDMGSATRVVV